MYGRSTPVSTPQFACTWCHEVCVAAAETKGVPLEEIVDLWRQHWYWKRFTKGEGRAPTDAELAAVPAPGNPNPKPVPAAAPPAASNGASPDCYYTI